MSTTTGFYLSWLRLTGPEVEKAEVTFDQGLNVFWGASETGKWSSPRKTGAQLRVFGTFELRRGDVPQR